MRLLRTLLACALLTAAFSKGRAQSLSVSAATADTILRFVARDGTPLEGKLSLPAGVRGRVPIVFYLHGAGPRNYDNPVRYRAADGQVHTLNYYDWYANELARRGVAFFRMSKRGCAVDSTGRSNVDRTVFSKATASVLLQDYSEALALVRRHANVDPDRVVLYGSSEGTRLAPQLARAMPNGIVALVLTSYAGDNTRETVTWQNSVGPWRNLQALAPEAMDGVMTRAEFDSVVKRSPPFAQRFPFQVVDGNADGSVTEAELAAVVRPRLDMILNAVTSKNDDFLWHAVVNLTSAYLLEDWEGPPTHELLQPLTLPIGIFHGELDGTTRVEAVRETESAFRAAGKTNLTVKTYAGLDHDLGWTPTAALRTGVVALLESFDFVRSVVAPSTPRP
jgi:alpha-beta hydrolase superfamily lysophospholipase